MTEELTRSQEGWREKSGLRLFCRMAGGRFTNERQAAFEFGGEVIALGSDMDRLAGLLTQPGI